MTYSMLIPVVPAGERGERKGRGGVERMDGEGGHRGKGEGEAIHSTPHLPTGEGGGVQTPKSVSSIQENRSKPPPPSEEFRYV